MASDTTATVRKGSCLCGNIKYELTGEPFNALLCHCLNCKKVTGSPFWGNGWFFKKQITIHATPEDSIKTYEDSATDGGSLLLRKFCGRCGATMFVESELGPEIIIVSVGSLDKGEKPWKTAKECYAKDSFGWGPNGEGVEVTQGPFVLDKAES
ncbi:uncharacterized protein GIQ15_06304 [Arthroderma uncinatum]|uniref:uncharacterized protein n=1 Tax=Arthroderma uncinatum TaxID=74035 RepID=UPI00144A72F1|nr:uncharacterized protein GIQ15_06304 [Arthroderma uncinatum]KAF3480957.1 hypothetical protein GIQ15_06304 [Arthroderma uncinatum]